MRGSANPFARAAARCVFLLLGIGAGGVQAAPWAYVTNNTSGTLQPVDLAASPSVRPGTATGSTPYGVAVSPDGLRVYVVNRGTVGSISVINALTMSLITSVPMLSPQGIAVSADGKKVYVAHGGPDNGIAVIDTSTNMVASNIAVTGNLYGIAVSPDGARLYVTSRDSPGRILFVDAVQGTVALSVPIGGQPAGVSVNAEGSLVYVASGVSQVFVFDAITYALVAPPIPVGTTPTGVAVTPGGGNVYVSNLGSDSVSVIAPSQNYAVIATIPVGAGPVGIALSATGSRLYTVNSTGVSISAIDTASLAVVSTIALTPSICNPGCGAPVAFGNFIGREASMVDLDVFPPTVHVGEPVRFGAYVSALGDVSGTVSFCDGGDASDTSFCSTGTLLCDEVPVVNDPDGTPCTVSNLAVGSHTVTVRYGGNDAFTPSASNSVHVTVAAGTLQTVSFTSTPPPDGIVGTTYTVSAVASSGLPVTLSIYPDTVNVCSIVGNVVHFTAPGLCAIVADQAGDATYLPASALQTINVPCYVNQAATGANDGTSWANAYTSLQSALPTCYSIWVAQGVYKPAGPPPDTFNVLPYTELLGGFAGTETSRAARDPHRHPTILSGDIDNNDAVDSSGVDPNTDAIVGNNSLTVVTLDGTTEMGWIDDNVLIDGFTITGGDSDGSGGGLRCVGSGSGGLCSPRLRNLVFSGNRAMDGGAMANDGRNAGNSNPRMSNITFVGNYAGVGGAIHNLGASGNASPTLVNVTFTQNTAVDGAALYNDGTSGGESSPQLSFATFTGNTAFNCGGAIFNAASGGSSHPLLIHALLWNDAAPNLPAGSEICNNPLPDAHAVIGGSLVQGSNGSGPLWTEAMGEDLGFNVDADPLLGPLQYNGGTTPTMAPSQTGAAFNTANDCLDAASAPVAQDQRGVGRPYAGGCDIGAVESQFDRIFADGLELPPLRLH